MRYSSRRKKQIALPLSKPTSEYNIKPRKKNKKQTQNKYIIKKKIHTVISACSCLALNNQNQNLSKLTYGHTSFLDFI